MLEARHPGTLQMVEDQDPELITAVSTGEFDLYRLTQDGRALLDLATNPSHDSSIEVSDQWHPTMWQDESVTTVSVDVPDISQVPESIRHLEPQG